MLTQFRSIQKGTLIVVTIVIVIAFAFFSDLNPTGGRIGTADCIVKVYDKCYRQKEAAKLATSYNVAMQLGMYDFAISLFGPNRRDQDRTDFLMSLIILREEGSRLGVEPTAEEIKSAIPDLPVFQQPFMTKEVIENRVLGPNGFTEGDLAQLVKDYLTYQKLRELLGSGIQAIPGEMERLYVQSNQRFDAKVVRVERADFVDQVEISEDAISTYFDQESAAGRLQSEPKRGFEFITFVPKPLPDDATEERKTRANLEFAKAVNRAYSDLTADEADFAQVAQQYAGDKADFTATVESIEPFSLIDAPESLREDRAL
ncbi:MAG: SurA N-terminal domain-containing protein, partial [Verrucomicrobiota bacterium]